MSVEWTVDMGWLVCWSCLTELSAQIGYIIPC